MASAPPVAACISVALVEQAARDLSRLRDRTELSETDIVNRAISAYDFLDQLWRDGDQLFIRRGDETLLVTFL